MINKIWCFFIIISIFFSCINGNLESVNQSIFSSINDNANNIDYDNYSSVLTSMDPVTYFKHICDNLRYNILYDADANQYKIIIFENDNGRDLLDYIVSRKETVFGKIYSDENG